MQVLAEGDVAQVYHLSWRKGPGGEKTGSLCTSMDQDIARDADDEGLPKLSEQLEPGGPAEPSIAEEDRLLVDLAEGVYELPPEGLLH